MDNGKTACGTRCEGCPFKFGKLVGSKGNPNAPFVIIGESPGKQEVKEGLPFVGPSGELLHRTLERYGVREDEVYFLNALQCFPGKRDDKTEALMQQGAQQCRAHVLEEIAKAPRKVILALGSPALWSVENNYDLKITKNRGRFFETNLAEIGYVPSVHPAFLMAGGKGGTYQQWIRDVEYAVHLLRGKPPKRPPVVDYVIARDEKDVFEFVELIHHVKYVAADIETSGFSHISDRILCAGYAWHANNVFIIPEELTPLNKYVVEVPTTRFGWHNGQFDIKFLRANGANARIDEDTILLSYALDENGGIHGLDQVASDWFNSPNWKDELDKHKVNKKASYADIPRPVLHKYMAYDVGNTYAILSVLREIVRNDKHLEKLYTKVLIPATNFLACVEERGLYADIKRIEDNEKEYGKEVAKYKAEILKAAEAFSSGYTDKLVGSPKQLQRLLYDDLKIKPYRNERGTGKEILDKLPKHPVVLSLIKYRKVAKEKSTYVTPAKENIDRDGCVHSSLALFKTATGRLASSDPNVQNIPRNPQIRGQYIPRPGHRYVEVDLNQAELRVLAVLSGDPTLCYIYTTAGMSLHDEVRAEIFGHPKNYQPTQLAQQLAKFRLTPETRFDENGEDLLVAEQKMRAKNVNFGIPYGITAPGLAEQTESSVEDAAHWINAWRKKFKLAAKFLDSCAEAPIKGSVLITPFGNKRRFGVVSMERLISIRNQAMNFPEQSSASHMTLLSGVELYEILWERYRAFVSNLIHDALLIECPDDDETALNVAKLAIEVMERKPIEWGFKRVPFIAEAKQGYRWGSLKKLKV